MGLSVKEMVTEGYLPITIHGGKLHGGHIAISGARSSQYLSSLLFLAPLLTEALEIEVIDELKSQPLVRASLACCTKLVLLLNMIVPCVIFRSRVGSVINHGSMWCRVIILLLLPCLRHVRLSNDPASEIRLSRLQPGDEVGETLLAAFVAMGADLQRNGDTIILRGGQRLHGIEAGW